MTMAHTFASRLQNGRECRQHRLVDRSLDNPTLGGPNRADVLGELAAQTYACGGGTAGTLATLERERHVAGTVPTTRQSNVHRGA